MSKSKKSKSKAPKKSVLQKSVKQESITPQSINPESEISESVTSKPLKTSPQVSIIVPMFNDKKYVKTCIDSILTQTYQNFELIVIDDRSTDRSYIELSQQYAQDSRVKLFRNVNHFGYDVTRSFGITHARGKYIYFMDADGAILPNTIETFVNAAEESQAEVVFMNDSYTTEDEFFALPARIKIQKRPFKNPTPRFFSENIADRLNNEFLAESCNFESWTKIQRRDFLLEHGISFPKTQCNGDLLFYLAELCCAKKIQVIEGCCYIQRQYVNQSMESLIDDLKLSISSLPAGLKYIRDIFSAQNQLSDLSKEEISSIESRVRRLYSKKNFNLINKFSENPAQLKSNIRDVVLTSNVCEPECVIALFEFIFDQKLAANGNNESFNLLETDIAMPKLNFNFSDSQQRSRESKQSQPPKSQPKQQQPLQLQTQKSPQTSDRFKSIPQGARLF